MGKHTNHKETPMNSILTKPEAYTIERQIGWSNLAAISGGRWFIQDDTFILPAGKGYRVEITIENDLYNVRRTFKRGTETFIHGEVFGVYCDQIGEVAYRASCYVNLDFGTEVTA